MKIWVLAVAIAVVVLLLVFAVVPVWMAHSCSTESGCRWMEGFASCCSIRSAMRAYASSYGGAFPELNDASVDGLAVLGFARGNLDGLFFKEADYRVTSTSKTFVITVTASAANGWGPEDAGHTIIVNERGDVGGTSRIAPTFRGEGAKHSDGRSDSLRFLTWLYWFCLVALLAPPVLTLLLSRWRK